MFGRGRPDRDPGTSLEKLATAAAHELLQAAAERLGKTMYTAGTIRAGSSARSSLPPKALAFSSSPATGTVRAWDPGA